MTKTRLSKADLEYPGRKLDELAKGMVASGQAKTRPEAIAKLLDQVPQLHEAMILAKELQQPAQPYRAGSDVRELLPHNVNPRRGQDLPSLPMPYRYDRPTGAVVRKADEDEPMTQEQAIVKMMSDNPELYSLLLLKGKV